MMDIGKRSNSETEFQSYRVPKQEFGNEVERG